MVVSECQALSKSLLLAVLVCLLISTPAPAASRSTIGGMTTNENHISQGVQGGSRSISLGAATLSIGSGELEQRESITVRMTAGLGTELLGVATIEIQYDDTVLDAAGCSPDPNAVFDTALCNPDVTVDKVRFTAISALGVSEDILLGEITFQAVGQPGQSSILDLASTVFADPGGNAISFDEQDGQVHVTLPEPTDTLFLPIICSVLKDGRAPRLWP